MMSSLRLVKLIRSKTEESRSKDSDAGSYGYTNDVVIYKSDADDNKYKADGILLILKQAKL